MSNHHMPQCHFLQLGDLVNVLLLCFAVADPAVSRGRILVGVELEGRGKGYKPEDQTETFGVLSSCDPSCH
jgi:hypothetical protein